MQDSIKEMVIWKTIENTHCAFRAQKPQKLGFTCDHLFNVEPKCAGNLCPIANSNYLTFQREETTLFMVEKEMEELSAPAQAWKEIELEGTKTELTEKVDNRVQELGLSVELAKKAKRKFERLLDLVTEIKTSLDQTELPETEEEDETEKLNE